MNYGLIDDMFRQHLAGQADHGVQIWILMNLSVVRSLDCRKCKELGDPIMVGEMSLSAGKSNPTRPIRVVHLVSALNVGGLEMFVWNLAKLTDFAQFALHIVCLGEPGDLAAKFSELNVPVVSLDAEHCSKATTVLRLVRHLRRLNPDILHTHNPRPHLLG